MTSIDIGVVQVGSTPVNSSLQLQGTGSEDSDFSWVVVNGSNTKGSVNASQTFSGGSNNNDTTAPELNATTPLTPADEATNAVIDADLTIKFNESVQKGTGNIVIKSSSDGSVVEAFDVATSPAITVSGDTVTINPTNNLAASTSFYVEIDAGAIEDTAGNDFAGISGNSTWNFTTGTEDSITPIYDIQGAAHTSPLVGQSVTTTGIVTAVDTNGFYLQDSTGDNNNATSDAIFVFTNSAPTVAIGDDIEVSGTVSEFFPGGASTGNLSTTQIGGNPVITIKSSGNALPAATIIGAGGRIPPTENIDDDAFTSFDPNTDGIDFFESLEAMLVTAKDAVAVSGTNRFGEIFTVVDNGAGATGISQRGTLNISPDDFNPERVQIQQDTGILPGFTIPQVDTGAKLGDVTGVVGYSFGNFEIFPTQPFTVTPSTIQPKTTTIEGDADKLTVASYNVLNLDPNDNDGDTDIADGRFNAIANQIVNNLKAPDIIGLQEVQDNTGSADDGVTSASDTLQKLVDEIAANGGPTYSFIDNTFIGNNTSGGQPGGNIRTAFLYNPERVSLVDGSVETIEDDAFAGSRLPLVAKFTFNDEEVTVVNNHFSSKGGSAPILGVQQPFEERQEEVAVNGSLDERQAQAQAVKGYVDEILAADANANIVVVGDLNEFEFVSPVETLAESLTNLTETVPENERYTFNFQGNSQSLDHILVSDNLANAELDIVHLNSEFAETTQRASDHDPLVASLTIPKNMDIPKINLSKISTFTGNGAEIVAHDPTTQRLFVTTGDTVEIIDITDPVNPTKFGEIDITTIGGGVNSVAVKNGIVAVAVEANTPQDPGLVAFYNTDGVFQRSVVVGALPDMLTFTPDGTKILVANEGEPNEDYTIDPEGSISIIDISGGIANATVTTAGFTGFNNQKQGLIDSGVRIFGPGATVAQDLEPEYIAVSPDGTKAFVTLQENNAIAVLDIATATVTDVLPLGYKDHSLPGNGLDASDRDVDGSSGGGGKINIQNWPIFGMYQPDSIASFEADGKTYYLTANEGDARIRPTGDDILPAPNDDEGDIFNEEVRIGNNAVILDPTAFPNAAELKNNANLGRLLITNTLGDTDGDGDYDQLYAFGGRSFSIWDDQGNLVFDSGDQLEQITAELTPEFFNANDGDPEEFDNRSDNKGPEPEAATVGVINGKTYGFVGLERAGGGVMVYDLSNPAAPKFVQYIRTEGDISPEGFKFISAAESPNGNPVLAVANEVSNTTTLYNIDVPNFTLQLLHAADQEAGISALDDAPRFSAVLNALKNQDADNDGNVDYENTLLLSSGDAYIPGLFLNAAADPSLAPLLGKEGRGRADIIIQNELGFQAIAFGNHEFDFGTGFVNSVLAPDGAYPGANFPYLSSNLDFTPNADLAPLVTADGQEASTIPGKIAKSTVITVNNEKIGVVGATTPTLARISSPGNVGILPTDPTDIAALAAEIQKSVDALLEANPDINKVVLLSHMQQIAIEEQLAGLLKNVDIIMAGGSNTRLVDETDRLRDGDTAQGVYPILKTDADGKPVAVINTDGNYKYVGRLVVDFDAEGNIITDSIDPNVSGAYATDDAGVAALNAQDLVDPEIKAITDALREVIQAQDGNVLGITDVFLNGDRASVRTEETNLGNLTADANLDYVKGLDSAVAVSIKNGGGIRDNIGRIVTPPGATESQKLPPEGNELSGKPDGGISQPDAQNALRFNNDLTLITLTPEQLKQVLEHGVAGVAPGATPGQFPQIGGVSFSFDATQPAGERIQNAAILNEDGSVKEALVKDGEIQGDASRGIRIVTLGFLASGGDGYPFADFVTANPTFANRVDLIGETSTDLNLNGTIDAAIDPTLFDPGQSSFANSGTEQDAFAEYLLANFNTPETAFKVADVPPAEDTRIQNLAFREDTVLADLEIGEDTGTLISGTNGNDNLVAGSGGFNGVRDTVFTGAGNDEVDLTLGGGNNRVNAGSSDDLIFVSRQDRVFGGVGNDEFDATEGMGGNRMSGGEGDDIFFLGMNDRALGGAGDDKFFVQSGGDNILSGGQGADQFWIVSAELPEAANTIIDFEIGTDVIGILGSADLGIDASTLELNVVDGNTEIGFAGNTLAILNNVTGFNVSNSVVFS
ncbi:choice-of-anchor I family protein [Plectonema cf. radiosum LEGE 06105]|uniref:Choice-of-anchor I family protein n=2 Tax=Plectonema TaxID=1183 RepID=A0A8J7F779_9CYAN|nr:choice-of-anchor I family protein [Plectonema cf. radiosum LEGE 06105]